MLLKPYDFIRRYYRIQIKKPCYGDSKVSLGQNIYESSLQRQVQKFCLILQVK